MKKPISIWLTQILAVALLYSTCNDLYNTIKGIALPLSWSSAPMLSIIISIILTTLYLTVIYSSAKKTANAQLACSAFAVSILLTTLMTYYSHESHHPTPALTSTQTMVDTIVRFSFVLVAGLYSIHMIRSKKIRNYFTKNSITS